MFIQLDSIYEKTTNLYRKLIVSGKIKNKRFEKLEQDRYNKIFLVFFFSII